MEMEAYAPSQRRPQRRRSGWPRLPKQDELLVIGFAIQPQVGQQHREICWREHKYCGSGYRLTLP
jgi:hypothetical protein